MTLQINGESRSFPDGLTVAALVGQLGMKTDRVAVELNLEIVPRSNWDSTHLKDGDKLEIVHFVGGGSAGAQEADQLQRQPYEPAATATAWPCPTCGADATARFCSHCGEKKTSRADLTVSHLFSHALEVVFHADSRIVRSFRCLLIRPGFLAAEYSQGRRRPYLHPFQVFFVANLIYFLLQPFTTWSGLRTPLYVHTHAMPYSTMAAQLVAQRVASQHTSLEDFTHRFDHVVDLHARSLVVVMVPVFALVLWCLEWGKRRLFAEHLVFALHFYAFWLIVFYLAVFGLSLPVLVFLAHHGVTFTEDSLDSFLSRTGTAVMFLYLLLALRTAYRDSIPAAAGKAAALVVSSVLILQIYRFILFLTALYSA